MAFVHTPRKGMSTRSSGNVARSPEVIERPSTRSSGDVELATKDVETTGAEALLHSVMEELRIMKKEHGQA